MSEKKANGIQLLLRVVVRDPDGKVISDTGRKPAKSFLIQFLEFIHGLFSTISRDATATDGTEDAIYSYLQECSENFRVDAPANNENYGIVVGTGFTAEDNEDHQLETQIAEGTGAGQLTHGTTTVNTAAVVGANVDLEVTRTFTNGSGNTITVKEAGMYTADYSPHYHCIIRDVLGAEVGVPDKCGLSVTYTLRTTV